MRKLLYCWCDGAELITVLRVVGHTLFCLANNLKTHTTVHVTLAKTKNVKSETNAGGTNRILVHDAHAS